MAYRICSGLINMGKASMRKLVTLGISVIQSMIAKVFAKYPLYKLRTPSCFIIETKQLEARPRL